MKSFLWVGVIVLGAMLPLTGFVEFFYVQIVVLTMACLWPESKGEWK